jgi:hypothetical protein
MNVGCLVAFLTSLCASRVPSHVGKFCSIESRLEHLLSSRFDTGYYLAAPIETKACRAHLTALAFTWSMASQGGMLYQLPARKQAFPAKP